MREQAEGKGTSCRVQCRRKPACSRLHTTTLTVIGRRGYHAEQWQPLRKTCAVAELLSHDRKRGGRQVSTAADQNRGNVAYKIIWQTCYAVP